MVLVIFVLMNESLVTQNSYDYLGHQMSLGVTALVRFSISLKNMCHYVILSGMLFDSFCHLATFFSELKKKQKEINIHEI